MGRGRGGEGDVCTFHVDRLGHFLRAGPLADVGEAQRLEQQLVSQQVNSQLLISKAVHACCGSTGRGPDLHHPSQCCVSTMPAVLSALN